jgi:hypothetical protein
MPRVKDVVAQWAGVPAVSIRDEDELCTVLASGPSPLRCADAKQDLLIKLRATFPGTGIERQDLDQDAKTVGGLDQAINNNLP